MDGCMGEAARQPVSSVLLGSLCGPQVLAACVSQSVCDAPAHWAPGSALVSSPRLPVPSPPHCARHRPRSSIPADSPAASPAAQSAEWGSPSGNVCQ